MSTETTPTSTPTAPGVTDERLAGLKKWNIGLTVLHGVQAIAMIILASGFSIAITSSFPTGPPGTAAPAPETLVDVRIGLVVAVFLLLAALDHGITATVGRATYERDLRRGINRFRWVEYSVSATIMILLICSLTGITGISTVVTIAGANVAMILFGWLQERMNPPGRTSTTMMPFWFGTLAGITPWIAITINVIGAPQIPTFVLGIFLVQALLFFSFGLNQYLQYKEVGKWSDYAYGEKVYLVLSLVAKSALAWQIFGGTLAG